VPVSQQSDSLSNPSKSQNAQLDTSHEGSSTPSITIKISEMPLIARYVAHALAIFMQPYYMHGVVLLCITHPRHPRLCMQLLLTIFFSGSNLHPTTTLPINSPQASISPNLSPYHPIGPGIISITISSVTIFPHPISYQSPSSTSNLRLMRGSSHPQPSKLQSAYYYLGVPLSPYLVSYYVHLIVTVFRFFEFLHMKEFKSSAVRKKVSSDFPHSCFDSGVNSPSFSRPRSPFADCRIKICHTLHNMFSQAISSLHTHTSK